MIGLLAQAVDQYGGVVGELPNTGFPLLPVVIVGIFVFAIGLIATTRK